MRDLKKDFERAGIVYCDDKGRYADFHSLRHTCATYMSKNGVPAILVKKHMRHSDMKQTNQYTDESQLDVFQALQALPRHQSHGAHICAQILGLEGQNVTQPDVKSGGHKNQKPLKTGAQVALWREETQNKMVEAVGIEPASTCPNKSEKTDSSSTPSGEGAHICAQILGADCPHLAQIVSKWSQLPPPAREAINQLVNTFVQEESR